MSTINRINKPFSIKNKKNYQAKDRRKRREIRWFYLFISPWLIGFIALAIVPIIGGLLISMTNYDGIILEDTKFVGLDNYARAFSDQDALFAIGRTFTFIAFSVPLNLVVSFSIALMLNRPFKARGIFRTLFYLPSVIPVIATIWIWRLMLDNNYGLVNGFISIIFPDVLVRWLSDYPTLVLVVISLWVGVGGSMIIFLAGLQGVPKDLEEAAQLDGAGFFQLIRTIILPLMTPIIFYQFVVSIIFSLQILVEPILLGSGSGFGEGASSLSRVPPRDNYLFMVHTFDQIFNSRQFGYGSALIWLLFLLTLLLTFFIFWSSRYWVHYDND